MKTRLYYTFVLGTAIAMSNMRAPAQAHNQPAITAVTDTPTPSPAQRALSLLKPAADRLSAAKAFTFNARGMAGVPSSAGQMMNRFFNWQIALQRPNRLAFTHIGNAAGFDLRYDGKTLSGVNQELGLCAQMDAPATLDEMLPFAMAKTGISLPCVDLLSSDVYANLTKDLTRACLVDKSAVDGVQCDHLVLAAPGVEWQIWLGPEKDPLPRRLMVTKLDTERQARFMATFSDWNLTSNLPEEHFALNTPAGAKQIELGSLMAGNKGTGVCDQAAVSAA